jgi:hypothetical protein
LFDLKKLLIDPLKDPAICGFPSCEASDNEKFNFAQGTVYKYSYESSLSSLFDGTDNNDPESQLFINAIVDVTFTTKCHGQMKLSSVRLNNRYSTDFTEYQKSDAADYEYEDDDTKAQENFNETPKNENVIHPKSQKFSKEMENTILRFDFRDGEGRKFTMINFSTKLNFLFKGLIQEICPSSDELVWVSNFKRGILSAFQNTMIRLDLDHKSTETDVSGKCEVSYSFIGSSNTSILITKTKDISSCQNRNKFKSIVQTTPYEFRRVRI